MKGPAGMFAYICVGADDFRRSTRFYDAVMATLGHRRCDTGDEAGWEAWAGWGIYEDQGRLQDALWICRPLDGAPAQPGNGVMVALRAASWAQVRAFHAAALTHGGSSEGEPGLRQYNADFYAAYVRDPDGNKLAVVCRGFTAEPG
jgi:catechol 2,3-dioxygenase-like lactoylglutathione lyase family enzyme